MLHLLDNRNNNTIVAMITYHPICVSEDNHCFCLEQEGRNVLIVLGLYPGTSDESHPDPMMRSILRLLNAWGYDGYVMLNLTSERCSSPEEMSGTFDRDMHKRNFHTALSVSEKYPDADVLAAFGDNIITRKYLSLYLNDIWGILSSNRRCLRIGGSEGMTAAGHPVNPLYCSPSAGLEPFDMDAYASGMMEISYGSLSKIGLDTGKIAEQVYRLLAAKDDGEELRLIKLVDEIYGLSGSEYTYMDAWLDFYDGFYLDRSDYLEIYHYFCTLVRRYGEYSLGIPKGHARYMGQPHLVSFILEKK